MKARILVVLCAALVGDGISVYATDTPAQAAARAALNQQMYELNHSATRPSPETNSTAVVAAKPVKPVINKPETITTNATALQTAPASPAPADAAFASKIPADNTSAQAAALAALKQKMHELNQPVPGLSPGTNSVSALARTQMAVPAHEASAAAKPVTEAPVAETPAAISPAVATPVAAPLSAVPAVAAPVPKVSAAPAGAVTSVAVVPAASPAPTPTRIQPAMILPPSSAGQVRPTNELVTVSGAIYRNVEVERVLTDAIVISYTPANGNWAMTKIYFRDLPAPIRRQYEKK